MLECPPVAADFRDSQVEKGMQEVGSTCGSVPCLQHCRTSEGATQGGDPLALHSMDAGGKISPIECQRRCGDGMAPRPVWNVLDGSGQGCVGRKRNGPPLATLPCHCVGRGGPV